MSILTGEDLVLGTVVPYQWLNAIKNHWRAAAAPADVVPGMIFSDSGDNKLYHCISESPVLDEILQATGSYDTTPMFDKIVLATTSTGAVSDPPTAAELNALFPTATAGFTTFVFDTNSPTKTWLVRFDGSAWWMVEMQIAL